MRYSSHLHTRSGDTLPSASFGRIARRFEVPCQVTAAGTRAANQADINGRDEVEAQAWRTASASGFGDAAVAHRAPSEQPTSVRLDAAARADRSHRIASLIVTVARSIGQRLRRIAESARQRRLAHATYRVLRELDARTLHDIGLHRCEIRSVAAELAAATEPTRLHSLYAAVRRPS